MRQTGARRRGWGVAMSVAVCVWGVPATAEAAPTTGGTLAVDVDVPQGGVALVEVRDANGSKVVRSLVVDQDQVVNVPVAAGTYRIVARQVTANDERFVGAVNPLVAKVGAGTTQRVDVDYVRSLGVQNLSVTDIAKTAVTVDWDAARGADTIVRRVAGDDPATKTSQGTAVPLTDSTSFTDSGLKPGGIYTYSIFARPGDGAFGRDDVDPVSITISTDDDDPATPLFVLRAGTQILSTQDAVPTAAGDRLILDLAAGFPTPRPGSILSVPVSAALPGGYLGEVKTINADGRRLELVAAPMASAFDLYVLDVADVAALPAPVFSPQADAPASQAQPAGFAAAAAAVPTGCSGDAKVVLNPNLSQSHGGHGKIRVDRKRIRFAFDKYAVAYEFGYTTTLKATIDVETSGAAVCGLDIDPFFKNLTVYPVPIAVLAEPTGELSLFGKSSVKNFGAAVTTGFDAAGKFSFEEAPTVDGKLIFNGEPTEPVTSDEAGLNLLIDGAVTFGPGVGTNKAGVIAGVSGNFSPLDATGSITTVEKAGVKETCAKIEAKYKAGISATAKAWFPGFSAEESVPIDALSGEWDFPGSPFFYPNDCTDSNTPTKDVVGPGVTAIADNTTGEVGKVDGFVPGQGTWVLSTGRIGDVVGQPATFASTGLGTPGNAALTALSGFATYDAASYKVDLIPNSPTLVVRYAFASEEYPEYVGSSFNDVMGVFVNGVNCSLVPGTTTPVSINSVNDFTNSQYYVDNSMGAAGYGTVMDGLTVPLECRVPVTPGEKVTVEIAVADASDSAYDSAIALLDGGIYSE